MALLGSHQDLGKEDLCLVEKTAYRVHALGETQVYRIVGRYALIHRKPGILLGFINVVGFDGGSELVKNLVLVHGIDRYSHGMK